MEIKDTLAEIREFLHQLFEEADQWFEKETTLLHYCPRGGGWTIAQVLEHIGLANHYLLLQIEKGIAIALANVEKVDLPARLKNHSFSFDKFAPVGIPASFEWIRPDFMEPTGEKTMGEIRSQLNRQRQICLACLHQLSNGEGILYTIKLTLNDSGRIVQDLGEINLYQYLYFLGQHMSRHISQMKKIDTESIQKK
jgi:DinB superfamily